MSRKDITVNETETIQMLRRRAREADKRRKELEAKKVELETWLEENTALLEQERAEARMRELAHTFEDLGFNPKHAELYAAAAPSDQEITYDSIKSFLTQYKLIKEDDNA